MSRKTRGVAVVTGASSGIGAATAEKLAAAGYQVFGTSRRADSQTGRSYEILPLEVSDDDSVKTFVGEVIRRAGRIDLLVNNAGFGVAAAGAEEVSIEQAKHIFETNFFGVLRMTQAVLPHMRKQGAGRILNMGSVLGLLPMPYGALYSATKHAIEGYSESLDHEVRTLGIRVSVIEPAYTKTPFDANLLEADAKLEAYQAVRTQVAGRVQEVMSVAQPPSIVADTVLKAATATTPKLRYTPRGLATQLRFLRRFAPAGLVDGAVRNSLGLRS
jgi:NAD(P)-dependent dehydrogenase (short-subunit alcohol dehydrogenase family)